MTKLQYVIIFIACVMLGVPIALAVFGDECLRTETKLGYVRYWGVPFPLRAVQCVEWKKEK